MELISSKYSRVCDTLLVRGPPGHGHVAPLYREYEDLGEVTLGLVREHLLDRGVHVDSLRVEGEQVREHFLQPGCAGVVALLGRSHLLVEQLLHQWVIRQLQP